MKAVDFRAEIKPDGQISVPHELACQVPPGEQVEVMLRWSDGDEDAWREAGRRRFEAAYSSDDSVYEQLINDASTR